MVQYKIGDKAVDKNGRIFEVEQIEEKDFGAGPSPFLVMKPCFDYEYSSDYRFYVPMANAHNILHSLMTREQALDLIDHMGSLESYPEIPPRERKIQFQNIVSTGDRKEIFRVIKSLIEYRNKRKKINKPFSDFDARLLKNLETMLVNEMSLSLSIPVADVPDFVKERTGSYLFGY